MPSRVNLAELLDLSIGTPEIGAVNFNALHALLTVVLKQLNLQDFKTELPPQITEQTRSIESLRLPSKEKRKPSLTKAALGRLAPQEIEAQVKDLGGQVQDLGKQIQAIENQVQDIGSHVNVFGEQMAALDRLPSGTDLLEKTPTGSRVSDIWQMLQLKKKVEANEDGVSKAIGLIEDVMNEVKDLKGDPEKGYLQKDIPQVLKDTRAIVEELEERIQDLQKLVNDQENNLEIVSRKISTYPEDNSIVTWEDLEEALSSGRRTFSIEEERPLTSETALTTTDMPPDKASQVSRKLSPMKIPSGAEILPTAQEAARARQIGPAQEAARARQTGIEQYGPQPLGAPQQFPPLTPVSGIPPSAPPGISQFPPVAPGIGQLVPPGALDMYGQPIPPAALDMYGQPIPPAAPGVYGQPIPPAAPGVYGQPPYPPPQPSMVPQTPWEAPPPGSFAYPAPPYRFSREKGSLEREGFSFPFALETLRTMGELTNYYMILKEQMGALDEDAGHSELEKLQFLIGKLTKKAFPDEMLEQLRGLKALTKEIKEEQEKMKLMQRILEGEEEDVEEEKERPGHLGLQLNILRLTVNDIEKELALLRERQEQGKALVEQSVNEATLYLQEQLDKLRMIIEGMLTSSSTLLSMSMVPSKPPVPLEPGKIDSHTTCPACSLDLSQQVSRLVQRYEQLQDMVNNLMMTQPSRKYHLQNQDEELLGHIQATILQVQGDCEKLNVTTGNLIEDHRQKQKDIDVLYQSLEKLKKEKANREHLDLEIDVKADKTALAAKVSRIQFDATTEQLNQMMQDLLKKMTGQEKDWKKVLDKLLVEMDTKLDRLELDPVKKLLEDRWKSLRKQLKEQSPLYQSDEAAAMRRQLLAHFHCLSCDRPLETAVPGPIIPSVPSGPGLPAHRSNRPYTIYELEQVRQQSRNMRLGPAFQRMELGQLERSVGRLHSMHSKMLMDIEKVQIHFGGSVKASSQMIRELIQAQCLSSSYYKRIQDMPDYSYMSVPRRCGGSHTLTFPYRRYSRLQHLAQCVYPTEDGQALKHEVDILGLDGHIYKGRLETRLPGIPNKESPLKNKPKNLCPVGQNRQSPSRPQSAQMLVASMSAQQTKGRPVSSQGRLTQLNGTHPPSPNSVNPNNLP
ncbi:glutamine-rich protein 2 isoform X1 [Antechinus flavipes]|uniref:glutamine-rich protein 2 isoform X1 n=1 Tax=Antechinus flavipes TaxID=38775 RepID=UPI002236214B|nr:glutamine-rich protein 2 isoform X1 [Antechinus flavipes]